jgi:hypothetical protein
MLPQGAGTKDGSSWENAREATPETFQASWDALTPGDTFFVGSGSYPGLGIKARKGGETGKPVKLIGVDRGQGLPHFTSDFNKKSGGATFFAAKYGVSNYEISGFHLTAYQRGVFIRGQSENIKLTNFLIEGANEGIRSDGGAIPGNPDIATHNVYVADCRFDKFVKRGLRLQGGNYNWKIERCWADAGGKEWAKAPFAICYQISTRPGNPEVAKAAKAGTLGAAAAPSPAAPAKADDSAEGGEEEGASTDAAADEFRIATSKEVFAMEHDIEMYDCVALNAYHEKGTKGYWNGDGFCSERGARKLKFVRCVSMHHTDGGWDCKSDEMEFIDCIAIDNKENWRLWSGEPVLKNCVSAYSHKRGGTGGAAGLWTQTKVELINCTFVNAGIALDFQREAKPSVVFKDSVYIGDPAGFKKPELIKFEDSFVAPTADAAGIKATADMDWSKLEKAVFDNAKFGPAKGFSSKNWGKGG